MDRFPSLDQSLSVVGAITAIGIKLSLLRFTVIVSLSNSSLIDRAVLLLARLAVSKGDNLSNNALYSINVFLLLRYITIERSYNVHT